VNERGNREKKRKEMGGNLRKIKNEREIGLGGERGRKGSEREASFDSFKSVQV